MPADGTYNTHAGEVGLAPQTLSSPRLPVLPSSFDAHHAPATALLDRCVHCGFCLPACPTYTLWGEEPDSPRGRIWMMRKATRGEVPLDAVLQHHMDQCLGCMACVPACPSGVEYGKLIEDTRAQLERHVPRSLADRLFRKLLFALFPHPRRLKLLRPLLWLYQRSGLQALLRRSGFLRMLPHRLRALEALTPRYTTREPLHTDIAGKRGRVGMLTGCVQDALFSHVNAATARVLAAEGYIVIPQPSAGCCGALMVHTGMEAEAIRFAKRMIESFEEADVHTIVINAAGCGSTMKEYGHLLRDEAGDWPARASAFAAKCRDVTELLLSAPELTLRHALRVRIAYHDACHLRSAQGIYREPRTLLQQIPGLQVAELAEPTLCCGSAGVYNLLQPAPAEELGARKVDHLLSTGAVALVSANPGCLLQLSASLRRQGHHEMPAFHMIELLDASIRGIAYQQLLRERGYTQSRDASAFAQKESYD